MLSIIENSSSSPTLFRSCSTRTSDESTVRIEEKNQYRKRKNHTRCLSANRQAEIILGGGGKNGRYLLDESKRPVVVSIFLIY